MPRKQEPEPWKSFLTEIDQALRQRVVLECGGGFALAMLYGLPRPTVDIDCLSVVPVRRAAALHSLAGEGSRLHKRYGLFVQQVRLVTLPENYAERLIAIFPGAFQYLRVFGLEAHDLALSKLERNSARDREDVRFLAKAAPLDLALLEKRYHEEFRPYLANTDRHDLTIRLWLEMLSEA